MITVAIIDDGLNYNNVILSCRCTEFVVRKGKIRPYISGKQRKNSHGLICAKLLADGNEKNIEIISYKIKEEDKPGFSDDLALAINDAADKKVSLIHMSVGSTREEDCQIISEAINKAVDNKICIVAASDNFGEKTYPACLDGVIGVKHNFSLVCQKPKIADKNELGINIELCCPKTVEDTSGGLVPIEYCNSFAAAKLSSEIISNMLEQKRESINDVIDYITN